MEIVKPRCYYFLMKEEGKYSSIWEFPLIIKLRKKGCNINAQAERVRKKNHSSYFYKVQRTWCDFTLSSYVISTVCITFV